MPMASNSPRAGGGLKNAAQGGAPPGVNVGAGGGSQQFFTKRDSAVAEIGLRAATRTNLGHLSSKLDLDFAPTDSEEPSQAVLKAIMDDHNNKQGAKKKTCYRRFSLWKKHLGVTMKLHKDLVALGHVQVGKQVYDHPWPKCRRLVTHRLFETVMTILILANCIIIGWQAELRNPQGGTLVMNMIIEHLFTFLFSAELVLRAVVFNWTFWFDTENSLDIFLVILSVLKSWILEPANVQADFLRKATVLRILRLVRIAKNFKRRFKEMWQLLRGLVDSFETLLWTYVMMLCVLYFFAISATTLFGKMGAFDGDPVAKAIVTENFSDVLMSMLALFQIMTLDSWSSMVRPLMRVHVWSVFFFILFITVSVFLLMNLITSVIVTQAVEHGKEDKAEVAAEMEAKKEAAIKDLVNVFQDMDEDGGGTLSREEVAKAWKIRRVRQKFRTMDIGKRDLIILWTALDDGDGELSIEEFIQGMRKLKGEAKAKDILKLYREVKILDASIKEITILSDYSKERMNNIRMKLRTTFRELEATRRTLSRIKETARLASKAQALCV